MLIVGALLAFLISTLLTWRFCNPKSRLHILDHPNERSLHVRPTPRSGGVALLGGLSAGMVVLNFMPLTGGDLVLVLLCGAPLVVISFLDDRFGLPAALRFVVHFAVALALAVVGFAPDSIAFPGATWSLPALLGVSILVLFVVWMINLYNFMDGMDGFAGGMAVVGFTTYAVLGNSGGSASFAAASVLVAMAAAGFLVFNFPPARIFLGDTGSSVLGYLAAAFTLWAARDGLFPMWVAVIVFSPFIVDATVTLMRRVLAGEKFWRAHRSHYYQRLVRLGYGHRRTVLMEYVLMLSCSVSSLLVLHLPVPAQAGMLGAWLLIYLSLILVVSRLERQHMKTGTV
jgi:UDP-N-acetylmuramyl pentapeptide phosphotransferase/UDP-N-acetylglucosamine-1-phosphate transferase